MLTFRGTGREQHIKSVYLGDRIVAKICLGDSASDTRLFHNVIYHNWDKYFNLVPLSDTMYPENKLYYSFLTGLDQDKLESSIITTDEYKWYSTKSWIIGQAVELTFGDIKGIAGGAIKQNNLGSTTIIPRFHHGLPVWGISFYGLSSAWTDNLIFEYAVHLGVGALGTIWSFEETAQGIEPWPDYNPESNPDPVTLHREYSGLISRLSYTDVTINISENVSYTIRYAKLGNNEYGICLGISYCKGFNSISDKSVTITINENCQYIYDHAFDALQLSKVSNKIKTINISKCEKLVQICSMAFHRLDLGTSVSIPSNVRWISESAFERTKFSTLVIQSNYLEDIERKAFYYSSINKVIFNYNPAVRLHDLAFANCSSLTDFQISKSTRDIDADVFVGCTNLKYATTPNGTQNTVWDSDVVNGKYYLRDCLIYVSNVITGQTVYTPSGYKVGYYVFDIPVNTRVIAGKLFVSSPTSADETGKYFSEFRYVWYPQSVRYIGKYIFGQDTVIESLRTFSATLTSSIYNSTTSQSLTTFKDIDNNVCAKINYPFIISPNNKLFGGGIYVNNSLLSDSLYTVDDTGLIRFFKGSESIINVDMEIRVNYYNQYKNMIHTIGTGALNGMSASNIYEYSNITSTSYMVQSWIPLTNCRIIRSNALKTFNSVGYEIDRDIWNFDDNLDYIFYNASKYTYKYTERDSTGTMVERDGIGYNVDYNSLNNSTLGILYGSSPLGTPSHISIYCNKSSMSPASQPGYTELFSENPSCWNRYKYRLYT